MVNLSELRYPKKSHRKHVRLPQDSKNLAEFFGIMLGDGGINNPWQATITVNAIKDARYARFVSGLCRRLFGISAVIRKRKNRNALVIVLTSTDVVDFLVSKGLCRGNKLKNGIRIPDWILANRDYKKACVRGLVDTDGCVFVHKHSVRGKMYRNVGLTFTSYSTEFLYQVAGIFEEFGILPHISGSGRHIFIYRTDAVAKYLKIFGSSNNRIRSVYKRRGG